MRPVSRFITAIVLFTLPQLAPMTTQAMTEHRGTTLVCAGLGGDGLTLVEWTAAELDEYEDNVGQHPAMAHPQTGTCSDPASLMVGIVWVPGTKWLCSRAADGRWFAGWVWEMYQTGDEVSPDPVTGQCPQGTALGFLSETGHAAAIAVHLTELEVAGDYERLYAWMHPDSRQLTTQAEMTTWYQEEFSQRPPVGMTIDDVRLVAWTWNRTNKLYPSAAEVTYQQRFPDGATEEGSIHLVRDNGVWRWFFGGSTPVAER